MDEPPQKKKKRKKWTETKPKKIMHANGTDSVANREALRHWKGRRREERNKIRRNNEGAFWETVVREIKAENHVTAKSFERAYTKSLQCIFFARSFKRCHGWRVSAWMFHEAPPPTTRLARTCECPRFDTIPRKSLSRQGMLHLIKTYRIVWFFFFFFFCLVVRFSCERENNDTIQVES